MSALASETRPAGPQAGAAPRPPVRRRDSLNLSHRPFLNTRPVVRAALALWLLGIALLLGNVSLFWSYLSSSEDKRAAIAERDAAIARQQDAIRQLDARLASFDLEQQNEKIDFLNRRIAERTFSWSLLFDRMAEVLPNDVRLMRLTPATGQRRETERLRSAGIARTGLPDDGRVLLTITGVAKDDEALDRFVDRLFVHSSFGDDANPAREVREDETNYVDFELTVSYIPGGAPQAAVPEGAPPVVVEEEETPPGPLPAPAPAPGGSPR